MLYNYVPRAIIDRPKQGFAVPIGEWLRSPLRDWAGDLLSDASLGQLGLICPKTVGKLWREHQSRKKDHSARLWAVINLQAFLT